MTEPYFKPWVGEHFESERVLIISESTYDWVGEDGNYYSPTEFHAQESIPWHIEHFGQNTYFTQMNRALTGKRQPSAGEMRQTWDRFAYTVFVQESVSFGPGVSPTDRHWADAGRHFLVLLEELRPSKVIVTGRRMWNAMPDCDVQLVSDIQAYKLKDGTLVWCLALPHPANRTEGFRPETVHQSIGIFIASRFAVGLAAWQSS